MYETEPLVEDLLCILKNEVHNRKNKNVEVLQLAENITRRMNGMLIKMKNHFPPPKRLNNLSYGLLEI